ncbi:hypothetical protein PanWU01x14_057770 [Parasponia andersonii]|uniref:Pentatricopeptide repeat n=1 Tax=Parasponia andersonii TaxID=3476 RepID=A0A2P5DK21_PARAD|nr:hypothetical protein PanWU01x14_057770 [Parasponia andersonii]
MGTKTKLIINSDQMIIMGCLHFQPNVCTMATVIKSMCRLVAKVNLRFSVMATLSIGMPSNLMLIRCARKGPVVVATEKRHPLEATVVNGLRETGETGVALKLCKEGGGMDEALSLFQDTINLGVVLDVVICTTLVHGLCEFDRWGEERDSYN